MNRDIQSLISGYLDNVLSDEQQVELAVWIKDDPANADQFAKAIFLDNRIYAEVKAAPFKDAVGPPPTLSPKKPNRQRMLTIAVALAVCALIAVGVGLWMPQNEKRLAKDVGEIVIERSFASVSQIVDADWVEGGELSIGDRLTAQTIQLRSGFLRLVFDDGVEVTLQGPAEYELIASGKTRMKSGLLAATVPPGAEGFTVDTPTAEVIDLGTAFGIDIQKDGTSHVSVFEGEVEVGRAGTAERRRLTEGEAVRIGSSMRIEKVDFDAQPFTKVWPVSSGIEKSTDAFRFVPPWPPQQRFVRSDEDIFIAPEGQMATLTDSLRVNISVPGEYSHKSDLIPSELPAGQQVRSFVMFFHPEKSGRRQPPQEVRGSITFDSPVLGLIVLREELQASVRRFARNGRRHINESQPLELTGNDDSDVITLSEDRRTLTVGLTSPARSAEMMRVIIDASYPKSKAPAY